MGHQCTLAAGSSVPGAQVIGLNNHREFMAGPCMWKGLEREAKVMCGGLASIAVLGGFVDAVPWLFHGFIMLQLS